MSRFALGRLVSTRGIADLMESSPDFEGFVWRCFYERYVKCDWGDLDPQDAKQNDDAVKSGEDRILAAYIHPSKIIAVDFDGTLCEDKWPNIGSPNQEVIDYILEEQRKGAKLILWTNRLGYLLMDAIKWCDGHGIIFDSVNKNLHEIIQAFQGDSRKVFADEYIDDRMCTRFQLPFVVTES